MNHSISSEERSTCAPYSLRDPKTRPYYLALLCCAAATAVYCCFITPVYIILVSNVVWQKGLLCAIFNIARNVEDLTVAALLALAAVGEFLFFSDSVARNRQRHLQFGIILLKYLLNLVMTLLQNGWGSLGKDDFIYTLLAFAVEAGVHLLVQVLAARAAARCDERRVLLIRACRLTGQPEPRELDGIYPFDRFIMPKHPLLGPVFAGILISQGIQVLITLYYDLFFWGLPENWSGVAEMAREYLGILLMGILMYAVAYYVCSRIMRLLAHTLRKESRAAGR